MHRYRALVRLSVAAGMVASCLCVSFFFQRGGVVSAQQQQQQQGRDPAQTLATNVPDGFTVASVGDIILAHPATQSAENKPVAAILRAADVAMGNYEGAI